MPDRTLLLGRDDELARLARLVASVDRPERAVLVRGDPGIGKTELLTAVAREAADAGMLVLRTSGAHSETHLPYAGLHQLLQPVVGDAARLPAPQRTALLAALGETGDGVDDAFAVALAVLNLVRDRTELAPVALVVDDLHALDPATVEVLAFAIRRLDDDPVRVVMSSRVTPVDAMADVAFDEVVLEGLGAAAAGALVDRNAPTLDPVLRDRLLTEAAGNPLALVELAIAWSRLPPGTLVDPAVPLTTRLINSFASRLAGLPEPARTLVAVAALNDGDRAGESITATAVVLGAPVDEDALVPAIDARLLELDTGGLRFRHPLVRQAIRQAVDPVVRRRVHGALARTLDDTDRAVWHRAASLLDPDEDVAIALDALAARARRRGDVVVAITALERAAALSGDGATRGRRLVRAAELAVELGRPDVVRRLLDAADALDLDPLDRDRLAWRRMSLGPGGLRPAETESLVAIVERLHATGGTDLALDALTTLAVTGWWNGVDDDQRTHLVRTADRLAAHPDDARLLAVLGTAAPVDRGAEVLARIARLDPATREAGELNLLGGVAGTLGDHVLGSRLLDRAISDLRRHGRFSALSSALSARAWAAWELGDWGFAATVAADARRLGEQTGRDANAAVAVLVEGALAAARGDPTTAEARAVAVERSFAPLAAAPMLALAAFVRALAALTEGRGGEAFARLEPHVASGAIGPSISLNQDAISIFVDAARVAGREDDARRTIDAVEDLAARSASPMLRVSAIYGRAVLALDADVETAYATALASELPRWRFLHARLLLGHGNRLRRLRRAADARVPLRGARDILDALGAGPWADRARAELRATGEISPRRTPRAVDHLTAQELEIAQLAALGLTNREIGRRLFLSHRTVASHLYHVFPKLGITSRTQLALALRVESDA